MSTVVDNPENTTVDPVTGEERHYCAIHTTVESTLRCNKCGRYMCVKCAVRTPVGYRCKQCVHEQQDVYFSASQRDYIIAGVVSFALSIVPAYFVAQAGFGLLFFIILFGLPVGGLIGEVVHRAVGKRRGRYTWQVVAICIVLGSLVAVIPHISASIGLLNELQSQGPRAAELRGSVMPSLFISFVPLLIYLALAVGGAVARLRYGK